MWVEARRSATFETERSEGQRDVSGEHDRVDKMSKSVKICKVSVIEIESENGEPQWFPSFGEDACYGRLFGGEKREDVDDNGVG
jgi:hypothetical protein